MSRAAYLPFPLFPLRGTVRAFDHRSRLGLSCCSVAPPFGLECLTSVAPGRWSGQSGKELALADPFLHPERERTGNWSKPFWQWCVVTTPITSVALSSMRRALVNSWGNPTDSFWKSIFDCASWPLLAAQKASKPVKNPHDGNVQPRKTKPKAQAAETKQRDVFGRP